MTALVAKMFELITHLSKLFKCLCGARESEWVCVWAWIVNTHVGATPGSAPSVLAAEWCLCNKANEFLPCLAECRDWGANSQPVSMFYALAVTGWLPFGMVLFHMIMTFCCSGFPTHKWNSHAFLGPVLLTVGVLFRLRSGCARYCVYATVADAKLI